MDTSLEYIRMCTLAKEVQALWKPQYTDEVYIPEQWKIPKYAYHYEYKGKPIKHFSDIPESEQDQIKDVIDCDGLLDCNTEYIEPGIYYIGQSVAWGYEDTFHLGPSRIPASSHEAIIQTLAGEDPTAIWDKSWIWLPRQDQLQALLMYNNQTPTYQGLYALLSDCKIYASNISLNFSSMEQIWLGFAMCDRFKKLWNKETDEWIPIPNQV